jgi:uncharacterized protein (DUF362 family)
MANRIDDRSPRPVPSSGPVEAAAPAAPSAAAPQTGAAAQPAAPADSFTQAGSSGPAVLDAGAALEQQQRIRSRRAAAAGDSPLIGEEPEDFLGSIGNRLQEVGKGIGDGVQKVGDGLQQAGQQVSDGVQQLGQQVSDGVQQLGQQVSEGVQQVGQQVGEGARKVEEGAISVPMMVFGWAGELARGQAGIVAGRGTIQGPIPAELQKIDRVGVSPASVVSISPAPAGSPAAERQKVYEAQKKAVNNIGGYDFLSSPPEGKTDNVHTVLIKPGVNWGANGYPTCTSAESTYASTRQTLEEAAKRGAKVNVIVGDESGIENKAWGGTTMGNFEHTGVLDGAVRAGLEQAAKLEAKGDKNYSGARAILDGLKDAKGQERKVTLNDKAAIAMAEKAGVKVVGFDTVEHVRVPIPDIAPGVPGNRHFPEGLLIPKMVRDDVTDIINLPKPPGRHALMGCAGVSGAMKNAIGLIGGSDRVPALHGPLDRVPGLNSGQNGDTWAAQFKELGKKLADPSLSPQERTALQQKLQGQAKWDLNSDGPPNWMLHEKIAEMNLIFADKQRFTVTDMRKTLSTFGPDVGDTMDIGKVVASKHAATVDVLANSLIKNAYEGMSNDPLKVAAGTLHGSGDSLGNHIYGRTWLENDASAFDTLQVRAAMEYGLAPLSRDAIQLKGDDAALRYVKTPE